MAGWGNPVLGDATIEKWISVVPGFNRVFKVHYKITHFGTDAHADAFQELPVMYVNPNVPRFLYYAGSCALDQRCPLAAHHAVRLLRHAPYS